MSQRDRNGSEGCGQLGSHFSYPVYLIPQQRLGFTSFGISCAVILLTEGHSAASFKFKSRGQKGNILERVCLFKGLASTWKVHRVLALEQLMLGDKNVQICFYSLSVTNLQLQSPQDPNYIPGVAPLHILSRRFP